MNDQDLIRRITHEQPLPPKGFEARQENLLHGLIGKEGKNMRKKTSVALIMALALCLILTAVAVAEISGYSILSFLESRNALTPETEQLIQPVEGASQIIPGMAEVSLLETLFDGRSAMITLRLKPLRDDIFLIPDSWIDMSIDTLIPDAGEDFTVDYARQRNLQPISVRIDMTFDAPNAEPEYCNNFEGRVAADGSLTLIARTQCESETESLACLLNIRLIPVLWVSEYDSFKDYEAYMFAEAEKEGVYHSVYPLDFDYEHESDCMLAATLESGSVKWQARNKEAIPFPSLGVTITDLKLEGYALSTRITATFQVTDPETYKMTDDGVWIRVLDANGEDMESELSNGGESTFPDDNGIFTQLDSIKAMDDAPETLVLHVYNCWDKEMCQDQTVELITE